MLPKRAELVTREDSGRPTMTLGSLPQATNHQMEKMERSKTEGKENWGGCLSLGAQCDAMEASGKPPVVGADS